MEEDESAQKFTVNMETSRVKTEEFSRLIEIPPGVSKLIINVEAMASALSILPAKGSGIEIKSESLLGESSVELQEKEANGVKILTVDITSKFLGTKSFPLSIGKWHIGIPVSLQVELNLIANASKFRLNCEELRLTKLALTNSASFMEVLLGDNESLVEVNVNNSAGKIVLSVPRQLGIEFRLTNNLGSHNLKDVGLQQTDNRFFTENIIAAEKKILVNLENNVANFELRYS